MKFDIAFNRYDEWSMRMNKLFKRVFAELELSVPRAKLYLYGKYYRNEDELIEDTIHEIVETELILDLIKIKDCSLSALGRMNMASVAHLLTSISLYDGKAVILGRVGDKFKTVKQFMDKIGLKYVLLGEILKKTGVSEGEGGNFKMTEEIEEELGSMELLGTRKIILKILMNLCISYEFGNFDTEKEKREKEILNKIIEHLKEVIKLIDNIFEMKEE